MLRATGACSAPGLFQVPAGPQHPGKAELGRTLPVGSVRWLTSKGSPTSSHNIYFPFLDLSQHRKCRANRMGHLLLQFGSALLFPMLTVLRISLCPALCVLLWASG